MPLNSSQRWTHRTLNPKLMITNQLLVTTLQAMVTAAENPNTGQLDFVVFGNCSFSTESDTSIQTQKTSALKLAQ